MAFFGRIGNLLRQVINRQISSELCSSPYVFQAIRSMSSAQSPKLFVGGVSYSIDDQSLRDTFSKYGEVIDARIIMDRDTGRSRGFGFITYSTIEEASSAIQALDGQDLHGRRVKVNYANERPREYGGGNGGFGGLYSNPSYGTGDGSGYPGFYGNAPYGAPSGGGYSDTGSGVKYGNDGNYGGNIPYCAPSSGGSYSESGSGVNYGNDGNYGGNVPYGAPSSGGSYGDSGAYGGNVAGGYGSNSSYGGSGMNYGSDGNFAGENTNTGGTNGSYGGNSGNYGVAGGGGGNDAGNFGTAAEFGRSDNYGSAATVGGSNSFARNQDCGSATGDSSGDAATGGDFGGF